jgi:pilus assembly protein CpaC
LNGFEVPGIDTRKVNTEVELGDGQSFVIGGLLDNRDTESFEKIPFLGDIPILGRFFQSTQVTKTNTELLVLVTPEVVKPIEATAAKPELKYPNKFLPPNSGIPMTTPEPKTPGENSAAAQPSLPVEAVQQSAKPEQPLIIEGATGYFGAASTTNPGAGAATPAGAGNNAPQ